jgi:hypothetical protein
MITQQSEQQSAICLGVMTRTFSFLTDVGLPDIWVVDPQVQYTDDIKPLRDTGAAGPWHGGCRMGGRDVQGIDEGAPRKRHISELCGHQLRR